MPRVDKKEIYSFIKKLKYPLYFLDFETLSTAIPLYDGVKPYQRILFQYSLHVLDSINDTPEHNYFLAEGEDDPRKGLLSSLKGKIGGKGSIMVYYESFEKGILRELAEAFPGYSQWIQSLLSRIVDLYKPFGSFHYYSPVQMGSASVKNVLPAITNLSYDGMDIADGMSASVYYLYICGHYSYDRKCPTKEEITRIRESLLEYCRLDTEGMIHILRALKKEVI